MDFKNVKKQILEGKDLSRKGSVDDLIFDLVQYINCLRDYVTTSSCSGRALLYVTGTNVENNDIRVKKDCKWLFTSHGFISAMDLIGNANPSEGDLQFKYEPFILHVQCSNLDKAKHLHTIATGCGFRESGLTIGKHGKIILAIRSNNRLELPLSQDGVMLVSDVYLKFLAEQTNEKMKMNEIKVKQLFIILKEEMEKLNNMTKVSESFKTINIVNSVKDEANTMLQMDE